MCRKCFDDAVGVIRPRLDDYARALLNCLANLLETHIPLWKQVDPLNLLQLGMFWTTFLKSCGDKKYSIRRKLLQHVQCFSDLSLYKAALRNAAP